MTTWVLLRGLARETRHWGAFAAALQASLAPGDTAVAVDLPGNGTRAGDASPARVEAMVASARAELARAGHCAPFVLVALSLGAMAALRWAGEEPQAIRGCVLINGSLAGLSPPWQRLRPRGAAALLWLLFTGRSVHERERRILQLTSNLPVSDALVSDWARLAQAAPVTRTNVMRQLLAAARFRAPAAAPPVPLLLLASRGDRLVSVRCSRVMAARWRVPLHEHPSAGHDLPLDDPHWVIRQVLAWRRAVDAGVMEPPPN